MPRRVFLPDNIKQTEDYKTAYGLTNSKSAKIAVPNKILQPIPIITSAATADPLIGGWVDEGQSCSILTTYYDERLIKVSKESYDGYDYECQRISTIRNGNTLNLKISCSFEGSPQEEETIVINLLDGNRISFGSGTGAYKRCY